MSQTIKLKRSAVAGKVPTTSSLDLGEIALNTTDGKAYLKKNDGSESIQTLLVTDSTTVGSVNITGNVSASAFSGSFFGNGTGLTRNMAITGSDVFGNQFEDHVSVIHFDAGTGLNVSASAPNTAFIKLGSHFRDFFVDGSATLIATGSDEMDIIGNSGIDISTSLTDTNGNGVDKELIFNVDATVARTGSNTFTADQTIEGKVTSSTLDTSGNAIIRGDLDILGDINISGEIDGHISVTPVASDSNNSNGIVIQDLTFDGFGHTRTLGTVNLDDRYYTETEADSRFVNVTGDTITGNLAISNAQPKLKLFETDTTNQNKEILVSGGALFIRNLNDNDSVGSNLFVVKNNGDVEVKGSNTYFDGTNTYLRSDNEFQFLTDGGSAQSGRFKGIQVSTSYNGTPPDNGILFFTDTNLFRSAANTLRTNDSLIVDGNVGIGTTNPDVKLQVEDSAVGANIDVLQLTNTDNSTGAGAGIEFFSANAEFAYIRGSRPADTTYGHLTLGIRGTGDVINIRDEGNVGIGTTSPDGRLHVHNGSAGSVTANTNADDFVIENNTTGGMSILTPADQNGNIYFGTVSDSKSAEIVWIDSTDTLLLGSSTSAGNIKIRTGNQSDAVTILTSGNVGIGTTSPSTALVVHIDRTGGSNETDNLVAINDDQNMAQGNGAGIKFGGIYTTDGTSNPDMAFIRASKSNETSGNYSYDMVLGTRQNGQTPTEKVRITDSGNVGIGTSSPSEKLDVAGNMTISGDIDLTAGQLELRGDVALDHDGNALYVKAPSSIFFYPGNSNKANINSSGNFTLAGNLDINGTGTSTIEGDLTVGGTVTAQEFHTEFVSASIIYQSGSTKFGDTLDDVHSFTGSLQQSGSDSYFLGNVSIGRTTTSHKLHIQNELAADTRLRVEGGQGTNSTAILDLTGRGSGNQYNNTSIRAIGQNSNGGILTFFIDNSSGVEVERMRINSSGNVGIGTTSPTTPLHVIGNIYSTTRVQGGSTTIGSATISSTNFASIGSNSSGVGIAISRDGNPSTYPDLIINSSGNVGIGTSSPSTVLHLAKPSTEQVLAISGSDGYNASLFMTAAGSGKDARIVVGNSRTLLFDTTTSPTPSATGTTKMVLTNAGKVGIGTTNPAQKLEIAGRVRATTDPTFEVYNSSANRGGIQWSTGITGTNIFAGGTSGAGAVMTFQTNTAERMRINSSGNVLVGKTSTSSAVVGTTLWNGGYLNSTVDSDYVARFNRLTTDGDIVQFQKSSTAVGSISADADGLGIGSTDVGLLFLTVGQDRIIPRKVSTTAVSNNLIDLGDAGSQFKDLYLGGQAKIATALTASGLIYPTSDGTINQVIATDGNGNLSFISPGAATAFPYTGDAVITGSLIVSASGATNDLQIGDDKLFVGSNGNVGIGTTSPSGKLQLDHTGGQGATALILNRSENSTANGVISFRAQGVSKSGIGTNFNVGDANGNLEFLTNGTSTRMVIDSSGNVGIGTTSPDSLLDLESSATSGTQLHLVNTSTGGSNWRLISAGSSNSIDPGYFGLYNSTWRMVVDDSGNVGIGETTPDYLLHLSGSSNNAIIALENNGNGNVSGINFIRERNTGPGINGGSIFVESVTGHSHSSMYLQTQTAGADAGVTSALSDNNGVRVILGGGNGVGSFIVENGSSESLRINRDGNVGIGTSSPSWKLVVEGAGSGTGIQDGLMQLKSTTAANPAGIMFINSGNTSSYNDLASIQAIVESGDAKGALRFITRNTDGANTDVAERMRIDSSGNVGIGTTSPGVKLDVNGDIRGYGSIRVNSAATGNPYLALYQDNNEKAYLQYEDSGDLLAIQSDGGHRFLSGGANERMRITSAGYTQIKAVSGASRLYLEGTSGTHFLTGTSGGDFGIYNDTNSSYRVFITAAGNVGIGTTSPGAALHVSGSAGGTAIIEGSTQSTLNLKTTSGGVNNYIAARSDGDIAFSPGGSEKVTLQSDGKVGIGTASPANTLHTYAVGGSTIAIDAGGANNSGLQFKTAGSLTAAITYVPATSQMHFYQGSGDQMVVGSNVGIGTTSPYSKLEVYQSAAGAPLRLRSESGNSGNVGMMFSVADGTVTTDAYQKGAIYFQGDGTGNAVGDLVFAVNNTLSSANVSISDEKLRIRRTGEITMDGDLTVGGIVTAQEFHTEFVSASIVYQSGSTKFGNSNDDNHDFTGSLNVNAVTTQTIGVLRSSNTSTSVNNGGALLVIRNSSDTDGNQQSLIFQNSNGSGTSGIFGYNVTQSTGEGLMTFGVRNSSGTFGEKMRIDGDGNVGIGTTSPDSTLHLESTTPILTINASATTPGHGIEFRQNSNLDAFIKQVPASGEFTFNVGRNATWGGDFRFVTDTYDAYLITRNSHVFNILGSEKMRIDSSGNVGIGTTSPTSYGSSARTLEIRGNTGTGSGLVRVSNADNSVGTSLYSSTSAGTLNVQTNHPLTFATNNSEKMRIDSSGNVGIGTTSPDLKLHLAHSDGNNGVLLEHSNQASGYQILQNIRETEGLIWQRWTNGVFSNNLMTLDYSGNVGIGTTSPEVLLQVENSNGGGAVQIGRDTGADQYQYINFGGNTAGDAAWQIGKNLNSNNSIGPAKGFYLYDLASSTSRLVVDTSGNVGIGTTSPSTKLHITDTASAFQFTADTGTAGDGRLNIGHFSNGTFIGTYGDDGGAADVLRFGTHSGDERMRIDSSGNVGIGTNSPDNKLVVADSNGAGLEVIPQTSNDRTTLLSYDRNASTYQTLDFDGSDIHFNVAGSEVARINSSGFVGIGETNPIAPLHISRDSAGGENIGLVLDNNDTTAGSEIGILFRSRVGTTNTDFEIVGVANGANDMDLVFQSDASNERMRIDSSGNVGIGNTSPSYPLDIVGTLRIGHAGSDLFSTIRGPLNRDLRIDLNANGDTDSLIVRDLRDLSTRFIVNAGGNVGIGTTSPSAVLHMSAASPTFYMDDTSTTGTRTRFQVITGDVGSTQSALFSFNNTSATSLLDVMTLNEIGNVGIGTTGPDHTLMLQKDVHGEWEALRLFNYHSDGATQGSVTINMDVRASNGQIARASIKARESTADAPYSELGFFTSNTTATAPTERLTIDKDGNVGIGTTSPSTKLEVNGTATVTALVETSTRELKKDITELEDQSSVIDSLQPVSYTWKETEKEDFGLIAEDVADIAPHLVERDEEGNPSGIKYSKLSVLLLDVVQRQSTLIEDLNKRIIKLENERGN